LVDSSTTNSPSHSWFCQSLYCADRLLPRRSRNSAREMTDTGTDRRNSRPRMRSTRAIVRATTASSSLSLKPSSGVTEGRSSYQ
jgi:hypothetical protein